MFAALLVAASIFSTQQPVAGAQSGLKAKAGTAMSVAELLADFEKRWDSAKWEKRFRGKMYMRPIEDTGWKLRFKTLRSILLKGKSAVPSLTTALDSDNEPTRILAAQALSFLGPHVDLQRLQTALLEDKSNAVRLYAADALGNTGKGQTVDWAALEDPQRNRDVRKHIGYAKDRGNNAIADGVIQTLSSWDIAKMDTAKVGEIAPNFRLKSIEGKKISLSDFRGKKPVVLVFIYGDT